MTKWRRNSRIPAPMSNQNRSRKPTGRLKDVGWWYFKEDARTRVPECLGWECVLVGVDGFIRAGKTGIFKLDFPGEWLGMIAEPEVAPSGGDKATPPALEQLGILTPPPPAEPRVTGWAPTKRASVPMRATPTATASVAGTVRRAGMVVSEKYIERAICM